MPFYDFIEIGTSDFDTEIQKEDEKVGISIEPINYYLNRLPDKQGCIKLNMGISDYNGTCNVNYLTSDIIEKYNFPYLFRGCNSINSYHKTVSKWCKNSCIDIEEISTRDEVEVSTLYQLMNKLCIKGVYFLKIDTEGHDVVILKKFYKDIQNNINLPHVIQFETNVLSSDEDVNQIINLFSSKGYDLIEKGTDTILKLNLKNIGNKKTFTEGINKYYIMDHPINYNLLELPHENTLEGAKEYCIKHNCSGVTLENGIYQVRDGKYINYFNSDIYSWIFL